MIFSVFLFIRILQDSPIQHRSGILHSEEKSKKCFFLKKKNIFFILKRVCYAQRIQDNIFWENRCKRKCVITVVDWHAKNTHSQKRRQKKIGREIEQKTMQEGKSRCANSAFKRSICLPKHKKGTSTHKSQSFNDQPK